MAGLMKGGEGEGNGMGRLREEMDWRREEESERRENEDGMVKGGGRLRRE